MATVEENVRITGNVAGVAKFKPRGRRRPAPPPVTIVRVHPKALATARRLAGGGASRLELRPDGSVLVKNGGKAG